LRIGVVTSSFPRYHGDGAGTFVYSICRELQRSGHQVVVLASDDPQVDDTWQPEVPVLRVRYVWPRRWAVVGHAGALEADVHLRWYAYPLGALYLVAGAVQLISHCRRHGLDVIFAQWIVPGGIIGAVASRLARVPLAIAVHGSDVFMVSKNRLAGLVGRLALTRARAVIPCSQDFADKVIAFGAPVASTTAIPYGVDTERFRPDRSARQWLEAELGISGERPVLVAMGRLVHKKGFAVLLAAMPALLSRYPDTLLIVAGSGELDRSLQDFSRSLGVAEHVMFVGHVPWDQTRLYLAGATAVVVPSVVDHAGNVDGLPNVLLEAMACGSAIVASKVGGIPDVVADGANGILVPPGQPDALAAAIADLLANPVERARLGANARATACIELEWASIASRVADVLSQVTRDEANAK